MKKFDAYFIIKEQLQNNWDYGSVMPSARKRHIGDSDPRITVSLSQRDHDAMSALAKQLDVSLSWLVRRATADFLQRHASGELQLPLHLIQKREPQ